MDRIFYVKIHLERVLEYQCIEHSELTIIPTGLYKRDLIKPGFKHVRKASQLSKC